jgi:hypothetical protein
MDWQIALVALAVGLASLYVVRQTWRTWSARKGGCGGGCCGKRHDEAAKPGTVPARIIPVEELTLRVRPRS